MIPSHIIRPAVACVLFITTVLMCAQEPPKSAGSPATKPETLAKGKVIPVVVTLDDKDQNYALYIPSTYDPARKWPIIYAMDPSARGITPVELAKPMAEKYGYIVAGSNISRNGSWERSQKAVEAMWKDTHERFNVDELRIIFSGFSGGARVGYSFAMLCQCAEAVLANGAGAERELPLDTRKIPAPKFAVFASTGEIDFNHSEVVKTGALLDKLNMPNRVRSFEGTHQWPPDYVWQESIEWLVTLEMKIGRRAKDATFLDQQFRAARARAEGELEGDGDRSRYDGYYDLKKTVELFDGIADAAQIAPLQKRVASLETDKHVLQGRRREQQDFELQEQISRSMSDKLAQLTNDPVSRVAVQAEFIAEVQDTLHRRDEAIKKDPAAAQPYKRALGRVYANAMQRGDEQILKGDGEMALQFYKLGLPIAPISFYVQLEMARAHMRMGDRKAVLADLNQAVDHGFREPEIILDVGDFIPLHNDPEFKAVIERARKK